MIAELSQYIVIIGFLAVIIVLAIAVRSFSKKLAQIQRDLHNISLHGAELIHNLNELTEDLKKKSKSLNFIFHFLDEFNKKNESVAAEEKKQSQKNTEKAAEIVDLIGTSINLFNRISGDIKKYVKSR